MEKVCRNCKFWNVLPDQDDMGDCFGHTVPGSLDANKCPTNSFQQRE